MTEGLLALLQRVGLEDASGKRSSAIRPLMVPIVALVAVIGTTSIFAPVWVTIVLMVILASFSAVLLAAYWFLLKNDRDALRTEDYQLRKMAMQGLMMGDSNRGLISVEDAVRIPGVANALLEVARPEIVGENPSPITKLLDAENREGDK